MNMDQAIERIRHQMYGEGFMYVSAWQDAPGLDYGTHTHRERVGVYILSGSIELRFGNRRLLLREGERMDLPAWTEHGTKIGPNGALYVLGEMISGDAEFIPQASARRLARMRGTQN